MIQFFAQHPHSFETYLGKKFFFETIVDYFIYLILGKIFYNYFLYHILSQIVQSR